MRAVQPDIIKQYEIAEKAVHNITRIARDRGIEASIIKRQKIAIGIAAIIASQEIRHPEAGAFRGGNIDYWLKRGEDIFTHREVVRTLLDANAEETAFATIVEGHPNLPQGLERWMSRVGEPAQLMSGAQPDRFDIARAGQIAQLYVYPPELAALN